MSVCYNTSLTINGKKKELTDALKYLNNYNKNHKNIYFDNMKVKFTLKKMPKDFKNGFYINDGIIKISDKELEKNLNNLDDNKDYSVYISGNGPYGRYDTIENIGFFEELADISLDITFDGEIVGGDYLPENRLEANYDNKKLYYECFLYSDDCSNIYINAIKEKLSYDKFCELFKIDQSSFTEDEYNDFIGSEIAYQDFPYFYSYDYFKDVCPISKVNEQEYEKAINELQKLKIESIIDFFYVRRQDYWDSIEYDPITKENKV